MSIARLCLRIATVQALLNRTFADDRVKDSSIVPLESAIMGGPKSVILVYTDDTEFVPTGKAIWGGQGQGNLVLILAVAGAQKLTDDSVEFTFPPTDMATEMSLDMLERQVQAALMDPDNLWAQIWRGIVAEVTKYKSVRGASTKEGQRFAARQVILDCETCHDPIPGAPAEGVWAQLLEALEAHASTDMQGLAAPLRILMEKPAMVDWKRDMAELGINADTAAGIGIAPFLFHPVDGGQAATLTTIEVEDERLVTEITEGDEP